MRGLQRVVCIVGASLVAAHAQQPLQAGGSGYFGIGVNWVMAQEHRNLQRSGASRVVQQQQPTGAEASAASTGTVPAPAAQGTTGAGKQQTPLRQQLQVASGALHAQKLAVEGATRPLPVPEPVGQQIEGITQNATNDYAAFLESQIQQLLSAPLPQTFWLGAMVPAVSGLEALGLIRQAIPFLKERLRQQAQPDPNLANLVSALSDDEHLKSALLQESKRLLEQEIVSTPAAYSYLKLVKTLKQQEEQLRKELLQIPKDQQVMANKRFVDLYNQYLQLQRDIINVAALAASNYGLWIKWQNLLDRAIANLARPVFDLLRQLPLAVPSYDAVENVWRELQKRVKDNEKLKPALEKLKAIRAYSGGRLSLEDSAEVARLYQEYVEALRQAGLKDETVDRLSRIVYRPGSLPGLGWSSGPIIEGPR
jgi:hypothetical protein